MKRKIDLIYIQKMRLDENWITNICLLFALLCSYQTLKLSGFEIYFSKLCLELRSELWASVSCCLSQRRLKQGLSKYTLNQMVI